MGNLVGVVAAISAGGAGAVFWMWITALIGSSTAFVEATLAQLHKEKDPLYGGYRKSHNYIHHYMEEHLAQVVCESLHLDCPEPDLTDWTEMVENLRHPTQEVIVALVGKYIQLHDAYISVVEALKHGGIYTHTTVNIKWIDSETVTEENAEELFSDVSGILVPGGFGHRGVEAGSSSAASADGRPAKALARACAAPAPKRSSGNIRASHCILMNCSATTGKRRKINSPLNFCFDEHESD